ncbi:solute carrier family 3 member 2b [Pristis pectinata]|uniref:solute carrier family 3 member 2b n=1 Tax=Pristis pectinata TaxID=685728 RepID=UPI00223CDFF1|nr:solute carrier family 3 member 2b [Pristis pectinata]
MSDMDVEAGLKDVELNEVEVEPEKLPMNSSGGGPGDSNGALKAKAAEAEQPFTGLSKEELLKVANTPGWVRVRWALLLLFWFGWLAMLAGAIVIIVQAPRCKALPALRWWQQGTVYQLDVGAFQDSQGDGRGDLAGVQQRLEEIAALKVKGIVIGPIHQNSPDLINETSLTEIESVYGNMEQFDNLLAAAHRKGIKVILDLTPNYKGSQEWFGINFNVTDGHQDLLREKEAFQFWLQKGVDGIRLGGIEQVLHSVPSRLMEWQNLTRNFSVDEKPRVLIVSTVMTNLGEILQLLNQSDVDLVFSNYLHRAIAISNLSAAAVQQSVEQYINGTGKAWPSWAVSGPKIGHMATMNANLAGLLPVMLFTLPGTPFIYYGDEIGLQGDMPGQTPWMLWNSSENAGFTSQLSNRPKPSFNRTVEGQKSDSNSHLSLFKKLSLLKVKERSLQFGEFRSVYSSGSVYAYLRAWDQSDRFMVLLNFGTEPTTISLRGEDLPAKASVELSSLTSRSEEAVELTTVSLGGGEGLVLKFPFVP